MQTSLLVRDACAWPVVRRLDAQRLGLVYFNRPSHGLEEGDLCTLVSEDDGATWRAAGIAAPHATGANRMHIATGCSADGTWLLLSTGFSIRDGRLHNLEPVWCSVREAGADAWQVHREVTLIGMPADVIPHGRIITLPDGNLAATFYRSEGRGRRSTAWFAVSDTKGRSWTARGTIGGGDTNEVVVLTLTDGRLLAAARTQADHHVTTHASDNSGHTWRHLDDVTRPMEHPADLIALDRGRVLMTYGIRTAGSTGIGARVSGDGGATWDAPFVVHRFGPAQDCGYPSTVRCNDGTLLTACYADTSPLYSGYHLLSIRWSLAQADTRAGLERRISSIPPPTTGSGTGT